MHIDIVAAVRDEDVHGLQPSLEVTGLQHLHGRNSIDCAICSVQVPCLFVQYAALLAITCHREYLAFERIKLQQSRRVRDGRIDILQRALHITLELEMLREEVIEPQVDCRVLFLVVLGVQCHFFVHRFQVGKQLFLDLSDFCRLAVELFDLLNDRWDAFYQQRANVAAKELSKVIAMEVAQSNTNVRVDAR